MRRIGSILFWVAILGVGLPAGVAQTPTADETQIHAIVQGEEEAWNRGDAEAFGAHYAENGSFVNVVGQQLYGKKAFVGQHAKIFSTIYKGSHCTFTVSKVTFLRPDVTLVEVDAVLTGALRLPPGMKAEDDGALHTKLLEVMTKEKDGWVIAAFHNVGVYPLPAGGPPK